MSYFQVYLLKEFIIKSEISTHFLSKFNIYRSTFESVFIPAL
jgi:hypothetical protein